MVPSGPPTPVGGGQPVNPSLLRSSSGLLGGQAGTLSTQPSFSSLVSPRSQYGGGGGMNMVGNMGNMANVSSLLNQSFANGGHAGIGAAGGRGMEMGGGSELDPLSGVANGFNSSFAQQSAGNPSSGVQNQHFQNQSGGQMAMGMDQSQQQQQLDSQNFLHGQQQFSRQQQQHHQQQQQLQQHQQQQQQQQTQAQYQTLRGGLGNMGAVKMEPQMSNEQNGPIRNLGPVKLEPQQLPSLRSLGPVKMEPHNSDPSMLLQQQQQQQLLNMSRQSPQAAAVQMNIMQQQHRLMMQQQQLLKNLPQQRPPLSQQLQQQNLPVRNVAKPNYEPGMCARRLTLYMYHQQRRPADNSIEFWRKFVAEYFAPHAKKRWCVSMYGSGRQTTGVFPQDIWHCEICNRKPGRGFETTVEVLPRLCKIKYDSGTLEELLYVDMPHEYQNASGQIVLDYAKAIQESVFEHLRVVREGQLRIVFSADLKICSWEFCARRHEELIPRRLIIPQVSQLGSVAQKYQTASQNSSSNLSVQDLQNNCNMFVSSARQLAKALEVPLVNDLGYTKRYVRCLQISEVVNSMKDLIDYSRETGSGPISSLINFPRRTAVASGLHAQAPTTEEQQSMARNNSSNDQNTVSANNVQLGNGVVNMNNASLSTGHSTGSATTTAVTGLLHQNVLNAQENAINNANSPYGGSGTTVQIPSAGSSTSHPQSHQANPSSPFPSPTPSSTNNQQPSAAVGSPANISMQQQSQPNEVDPMDSQSAVQQILQEIMMTSQLNGNNMVNVGSLGTEIKGLNGPMQPGSTILNGGPCIIGNGLNGNLGMGGGAGFSSIGGAGAVSMNMGGIRSAMASNNPMSLNGRVGLSSMAQAPNINYQNQDVGNRLLGSLGSVNSFNNLQFD